AIQGVGAAEDVHHPVELHLPGGEELHKAGQGAGLYFAHGIVSFVEMMIGSKGAEGQKMALSSRRLGRERENASWCHPISERTCRSLLAPCCGGAAAPVSGPAGGAVFAGAAPWGPLNRGAPLCRGVFRVLVRRHGG